MPPAAGPPLAGVRWCCAARRLPTRRNAGGLVNKAPLSRPGTAAPGVREAHWTGSGPAPCHRRCPFCCRRAELSRANWNRTCSCSGATRTMTHHAPRGLRRRAPSAEKAVAVGVFATFLWTAGQVQRRARPETDPRVCKSVAFFGRFGPPAVPCRCGWAQPCLVFFPFFCGASSVPRHFFAPHQQGYCLSSLGVCGSSMTSP